jgi:hypothetical protein
MPPWDGQVMESSTDVLNIVHSVMDARAPFSRATPADSLKARSISRERIP